MSVPGATDEASDGDDRAAWAVVSQPSTATRRPVYVSGHRNPDTDSIASAIAYADLKDRVDPGRPHLPVRPATSHRAPVATPHPVSEDHP